MADKVCDNDRNEFYRQLHNLARKMVVNSLTDLYSKVHAILPPDDRVTDLLVCRALLISALRQHINTNWESHSVASCQYTEDLQQILNYGQIKHISCLFSILSVVASAMIKYLHSFAEKHHMKDLTPEAFPSMVADILDVAIEQNIERLKKNEDKTFVCGDKCQIYSYKEGEVFLRSPYNIAKF